MRTLSPVARRIWQVGSVITAASPTPATGEHPAAVGVDGDEEGGVGELNLAVVVADLVQRSEAAAGAGQTEHIVALAVDGAGGPGAGAGGRGETERPAAVGLDLDGGGFVAVLAVESGARGSDRGPRLS